MATWDEVEMESPRAVLRAMLIEGLSRLLFDPMGEDTDRAGQALVKAGADWSTTREVDNFYACYLYEAVEVAGRLGIALVETIGFHASHEAWLKKAVKEAGLASYKPGEGIRFRDENKEGE